MKTQQSLAQFLRKVRVAGAPLVAVSTPDQPHTVEEIRDALPPETPLYSWSCFEGVRALTESAEAAIPEFLGEAGEPSAVDRLPTLLKLALGGLPETGAIVCVNAPALIGTDLVRAAFLSLRQAFKANRRTLILLGSRFDLPEESRDDFACYSVPLPTEEEVGGLVAKTYEEIKSENPDVPALKKDLLGRARSACVGLKAFAIEQSVAMSTTKKGGLDADGVLERKREAIRATRGLTVPAARETWEDVAGASAFKQYLDALFASDEPPTMIVQLDEFEKMASSTAAAGDNTGTAQEALAHLLGWMSGAKGDLLAELCMGVPGGGKSLITRACAGQHGVECAIMSLGEMKESLVGSSLANLKRATDVIDAMSGGRPLILATCNGVADLKPEIRRRFLHEWFFDLPSAADRPSIWAIWMRKFGLEEQPIPRDTDWTGADVMKCCRTARVTSQSLVEAAKFTTPYARAAREQLDGLRRSAAERFVDAAKGGAYRLPDAAGAPAKAVRKVTVD